MYMILHRSNSIKETRLYCKVVNFNRVGENKRKTTILDVTLEQFKKGYLEGPESDFLRSGERKLNQTIYEHHFTREEFEKSGKTQASIFFHFISLAFPISSYAAIWQASSESHYRNKSHIVYKLQVSIKDILPIQLSLLDISH